MSRRLIINADDLGLHPEIDEGVFQCFERGVVTSATVLVTGPSAPAAIARAAQVGLPLGVHLALCTRLPPALPAAQVPSLLEGGRFRPRWMQLVKALALGRVRLGEVEAELRAQLARLRALGGSPDHLDFHQHLHLLPGVAGIVARLAREEGLPVRWPHERPSLRWLETPGPALKSALLLGLSASPTWRGVDKVPSHGIREAGALTEEALLALLDELPEGLHEIGCHPGAKADTVVPEEPGWTYGWTCELEALTSPRVRARIEERGIALVSFGQAFPGSPRTRAA